MRTGKLVLSPLVNNSCRLSTSGEYDLLTTIDQHSQIEESFALRQRSMGSQPQVKTTTLTIVMLSPRYSFDITRHVLDPWRCRSHAGYSMAFI